MGGKPLRTRDEKVDILVGISNIVRGIKGGVVLLRRKVRGGYPPVRRESGGPSAGAKIGAPKSAPQ